MARVRGGVDKLVEDGTRLGLLGGFEIANGGERLCMPMGAQRLLAFAALQAGGVHRTVAAEQLWPDNRRRRAAANLRSALWHTRRICGFTVVECSGPRLRLAPTVRVDLQAVLTNARLLTNSPAINSGDPVEPNAVITALLGGLLPDWSEEWLVLERARWDQVRLHTLETIAQHLMAARKYFSALEAAFAAVAIEPIRESAHRTVLEIYIAEGNSACALKHYQRYRGLLHRELGVTPSRHMIGLVHALL